MAPKRSKGGGRPPRSKALAASGPQYGSDPGPQYGGWPAPQYGSDPLA